MADPKTPSCACKAIDAYDCWVARYRVHSCEFWDSNYQGDEPIFRELVDADGGPCECACHYEEESDEWEWGSE
jgi:hypothetical protein